MILVLKDKNLNKTAGIMFKKNLIISVGLILLTFITISGCSTYNLTKSEESQSSHNISYEKLRLKEERQKSVWDSSLAQENSFQLDIKPNAEEIRLAKQSARSVVSHLKNSDIFIHFLLTELKNNDLPLELVAIPLIESGINPKVRSNNGAHGAWQYIRSTGKSVGLHKTKNYDDVYDFVKSTQASVKYLKRMYKDLGNWELVVAAFNQGEYGVKKAIEKAKDKGIEIKSADDIKLTRGARAYIKRFRAYADIIKNPQKYNVSLPNIKNRPAFKKLKVADHINSLNEIAKISGAHLDTLKKLNAGYLSDKIDNKHGLLVPIEHADNLEKHIQKISQENASNLKQNDIQKTN